MARYSEIGTDDYPSGPIGCNTKGFAESTGLHTRRPEDIVDRDEFIADVDAFPGDVRDHRIQADLNIHPHQIFLSANAQLPRKRRQQAASRLEDYDPGCTRVDVAI